MFPDPAASASSAEQRPITGARAALALLLAINLFNYIDRYVLAAVLPEIDRTMLAGDPDAGSKKGWLATAFLISYMVTAPIFGWLADRFSRWWLIAGGVLVWSLASGASGLATAFSLLLLSRIFVGVGEASYGPAAPTLISDYYPVHARGRVLAWFYLAIPVGAALGYQLGGFMVGIGRWRWAFYAVVVPGILLGFVSLFMPTPQCREERRRRATLADCRVLLRTKSYTLNCLGMAAMTFAIGGMAYWMPTYVYEFRKAGELNRVNLIFGLITVVTGLGGTLLGGVAGDALRQRIRGAYFIVSAVGLALGFVFFLAVLVVPFPLAWLFVFLAELCLFFNTGPSNTALANVTHPAIRATAFAMNILFIHALGDAISPWIIGKLYDRYDRNLNIGFAVVSAMMLVGAIFWYWASRYLDADTAAAPKSLGEGAHGQNA